MLEQLFTYIRKHQMIQEGDRIVAGVSGGADSVCLLFALLEYRKQVDFALKVVHIEHGIRGKSSLEDAAFVEKLCMEQQVPFACFHLDIPRIAEKEKQTLEEAGRQMRYRIFEEVLEEWKGNKIAVAHNRNDQAETMLFQILRGSGLKGCAGIRPVRGKVIRPLLSTDRKQIEAWLKKKGISWREDETNQEEDYTRNSIRRQILPMMEERINAEAVAHLFALSEELQETESFLEKESRDAFEQCVTILQEEARIRLAIFKQKEVLIRKRIIRMCLKEIGCGLKDITREHIAMILRLTESESGKSVDLPGEWEARREFAELVIGRPGKTELLPEKELMINGVTPFGKGCFRTRLFPFENQQISQKTYTKWLDYDKIKGALVIRSRHAGDYLIVNRQGGKKKLKAYLTEEKIPVSQKDQIPLLCREEEVFWVIGHRIGETGKITPDTRNVLEIIYEEENYYDGKCSYNDCRRGS